MHPLHEYIAKQVADKLRTRQVLVWYDSRTEFDPFFAELRAGASVRNGLVTVTPSGVNARLAEYRGSFLELRLSVEPLVAGDDPRPLLVYVPGVEHDPKLSLLAELELAGHCYKVSLKRLARNVLRRHYTDGAIDELLESPGMTYEDLARASVGASGTESPSVLRTVFHDIAGADSLLALWLASDVRDSEIEAKAARQELNKLVRSRLGLELGVESPLAKMRAITLRYVLVAEFRSDLTCGPPRSIASVPSPPTKQHLETARDVARRLRKDHAEAYATLADQVEADLALRGAGLPAGALGSIDTFRFEERALLGYCYDLITAGTYAEALKLVNERAQSFWLDRFIERRAHWEACRLMAELGLECKRVQRELVALSDEPKPWVDWYTGTGQVALEEQTVASPGAGARLDQAQRRLEAWLTTLPDDPDERPLGVVRRAYEDTCAAMADGFSRALRKAQWSVPGALHQTRIQPEILAVKPKPTAYLVVDAMRFEMGLELAERLPATAEITLRPALAALPTITPVGMAALLPGASTSFSVVEKGGKLGATIDDAFLPDLQSRRKLCLARVPGAVDLLLDELLNLPGSKLARKLDGALLVVVRSQEIDQAGEQGSSFQARQVMNGVIDNLARAIRKLAAAGVEHAVVTSDHGHLFFGSDRDESMRIDSPGGRPVELHRRCWIGRGGTTPAGCVRVSAAALGYASDLDFIFPTGCGVFKAGGDLSFHHGAATLQELVVPVLSVHLRVRESARPGKSSLTVAGVPEVITNRIFTVTMEFAGEHLSLLPGSRDLRPLLVVGGQQVGNAGMAIGAELDRTSGCVKLETGNIATVAMVLTRDDVPSVELLVQDPATDRDLYRSPEIPVRLGV